MQLVSNKFLGSGFDVSKHGFPRQLEDSDLYSLIQTISFLGSRTWREGSVVDRGYLDFMPELTPEKMEHVAGALRDWPSGYFKFLDGICAGKDAPGGAIAMHWMFGGYYKCLVEAQKRLHFLFDGLQDYMNERLDGYLLTGRGNPAVLKVRDRRRYIPGFVARKQLRVGRQEFTRLVDRGFLQSRVFRTSYGDVACVHRDSVREYAEVKQRLVGRRQLSEELGISLHALYSLSVGNVLKPFHSPQKDGWPQWYYDRKAVDEWLNDLRALAQPISGVKQSLSLSEAVAAFNKQGVSYCSLFHAVGEGTLKLYRRQKDNESSLNCFHLSRFQLKSWYPSLS
ncbi:hypothetical protein TH19_19010 [Thalassospira profundimaris]|uniref:Uncharacterized protein n=2 Tax=Thalassospira TaxID=168934 RepID=A0A367W095_9PROT|nr:hypothetical protein TH19_19010 [Thalassospira profundimaris]